MCKKMFFPLIVVMLCMVQTPYMSAQSHSTQTNSNQIRVKFPNSELIADVNVKYSVYYDADDNVVKHGKCSAHEVVPLNANGVAGKLEYVASCNYNENKLDGPLSISLTETFTRPKAFSIKRSLSANYSKGKPSGKWVVSEVGQGAKIGSESYSITVVWKDGEIASITTSKGSNLTFERVDPDYKIFTFTGKWGNEEFVKGFVKSYFIRKTGEQSPLDEAASAIIKDIASGKLSEADLIDKGYRISQENYANDIFEYWEQLLGDNLYFVEGIGLRYYDHDGYIWHYYDDASYGRDISPYYYLKNTLIRVNLGSTETIKQILAAKNLSTYHMVELEELINQLNQNYVQDYSRYENVYFNNETKKAAKAYVMTYITRMQVIDSLQNSLLVQAKKIQEASRGNSTLEQMANKYLNSSVNAINQKDSLQMAQMLDLGVVVAETTELYKEYNQKTENTLNNIKTTNAKLLPVFKKIIKNHQLSGSYNTKADFEKHRNDIKGWNNVIDKFNEAVAAKQGIIEQDAKIKAITATGTEPVIKSYNTASKANKCEITTDVDNSLKEINSWSKTQKEYIALCDVYNVIAEKEANITSIAGTEYKDVLKAYQNARKSADLQVGSDLNACKNNANQFMQVQDGCLAFLGERTKISALHNQIIEGSKPYKNINKAYTTYFKGLNLSWQPTSTTDELQKIESTQEIFSKAVASPNASELDKQVKSLKDKSIQNVVKVIDVK